MATTKVIKLLLNYYCLLCMVRVLIIIGTITEEHKTTQEAESSSTSHSATSDDDQQGTSEEECATSDDDDKKKLDLRSKDLILTRKSIWYNQDLFVGNKSPSFGDFVVQKHVATALLGDVKLATHTSSQHKVIIKSTHLNRHSPIENPISEVQWLLKAKHPHVVDIIGEITEPSESIHWTILQYCSGGEIFDVIQKKGRLEEKDAGRYFGQLTAAVSHLHQQGLAHLDLSPENLLLDSNGDLKLCDFGQARMFTEGELLPRPDRKRMLPGKEGYMSPELLSNCLGWNPVMADMWSLGVILFVFLFGVPPFKVAHSSDARFRYVFSGRLHLLLKAWKLDGLVSQDALDLLNHLLCPVNKRYSGSEVLAHPWLSDCT